MSCALELPAAMENPVPDELGTGPAGLGVHGLGSPLTATQLRFTALLYPLLVESRPLKLAFDPTSTWPGFVVSRTSEKSVCMTVTVPVIPKVAPCMRQK
jgi:hypothetical protein